MGGNLQGETMQWNRREFLNRCATIGGAAMVGVSHGRSDAAEAGKAQVAGSAESLARKLPRWRGFNLLKKFNVGRQGPFVQSDFEWMRQWGFDFVRLPMDYRCWTDASDPYKPWKFHPIGDDEGWPQFYHGEGIGDVDADGRMDLIINDGSINSRQQVPSQVKTTIPTGCFIGTASRKVVAARRCLPKTLMAMETRM